MLELISYVVMIVACIYLAGLGIFDNKINIFAKIIYVIIGLVAVYHAMRRDYYLPFLGQTAYPCNSLALKVPANANYSIQIKTLPNSNVIYWASEPNKVIKDVWSAYDRYDNSGVALSDNNGLVTFQLRKPSSYRIPGERVLTPHVHYRVCKGKGMLGRVETVRI